MANSAALVRLGGICGILFVILLIPDYWPPPV